MIQTLRGFGTKSPLHRFDTVTLTHHFPVAKEFRNSYLDVQGCAGIEEPLLEIDLELLHLFGVEVVQAVRSLRARLLYDIYHMQIMEGDVRTMRQWLRAIFRARCLCPITEKSKPPPKQESAICKLVAEAFRR